jgi:hypothetical protein
MSLPTAIFRPGRALDYPILAPVKWVFIEVLGGS